MNEDVLIGLGAGVFSAFLFWWVSRESRSPPDAELKSVIENEANKVKGRHD